MSNMFTNLNLTDMEVWLQGLPQDRAGPDSGEVQPLRLRAGDHREGPPRCGPRLRIYEVGVAYYGRSYEEGKKINLERTASRRS